MHSEFKFKKGLHMCAALDPDLSLCFMGAKVSLAILVLPFAIWRILQIDLPSSS